MNQSIYLMVSVPYIALAGIGFLIYRGCKKNAAYVRSLPDAASAASAAVQQSGSRAP